MRLRDLFFVFLIILIAYPFSVSRKRWREMKKTTNARLNENFFPQLIDNLKSLDKRLSEEDSDREGYVKLLNKGWKSFWILDFRKFYKFEEEAFFSFKQDLEKYEENIREFKKTRDKRLRLKTLKRKIRIRKNLTILITRLEHLI